MFPKVQTWWNLDVRSHIYYYINHTISDMRPPPHTNTKSTYIRMHMALIARSLIEESK